METVSPPLRRKSQRWFQITLVSLLVVGITAAVQSWQERPLTEIRQLLGSQEHDKALKRIDYYLAGHPNDPRVLALKARTLVGLGRDTAAIQIFEQVGVATTADMQSLATAYQRQSIWSRAAAMFQQVVAAEPANQSALENLAACQLQLGSYHDALATAQQLAAIPSAVARGHAWQAFLYQRLERPADAILEFERTLVADPTAAKLPTPPQDFFLQQARVLLAEQRIEESQRALERSLAAQPNAEAYVLFAKIYLQLEQEESARDFFQKAIQLQPLEPTAREELAARALKNSQHNEAQTWLQPLAVNGLIRARTAELMAETAQLKGDGTTAGRWRQRATTLRRQEKLAANIDRLLARNPDSTNAKIARAHRFAAVGNWREAQAQLAPLVQQPPDDAASREVVKQLVNAVQAQAPLPPLDELSWD
jgi:tetratricopeptide (TPR) repeat protein